MSNPALLIKDLDTLVNTPTTLPFNVTDLNLPLVDSSSWNSPTYAQVVLDVDSSSTANTKSPFTS